MKTIAKVLRLGLIVLVAAGCRQRVAQQAPPGPAAPEAGAIESGSAVQATYVKDGQGSRVPAERVEAVAATAEALLQSCKDRTRRLVTEEQWSMLTSGSGLLVEYAQPNILDTQARAGVQITALLVPFTDAPGWSESVLARNGDNIHAPFTQYDPALMKELQSMLE